MDEGIPTQPTLEATDWEATVDQYLAEMKRLNEQMRKDQVEIDRLKVETRRLKAETRAILAELGAMV